MALRDLIPQPLQRVLGINRASTMDLMRAGDVPGRPTPDQEEYGVSGTEIFGGFIRKEDFNPELDDWQHAVKIYDKIRRTDATVRAMLQVLKLPLLSATWVAQRPDKGDTVDQQIADFINKALFDDDAMQESWHFTLRHILLQMDFGFSVLEKVWRVDDDGTYRLKRLAPRLPKTIREWHVNRDGTLRAIVQYAPVPTATDRTPAGVQRTPTYRTTVNYQYLTIPAQYCTVFSLDREGDNYEGWSTLRTIYRNWWYKDNAYRNMGVGIDRWGVGIPVAQLEDGHNLTKDELAQLGDMLKGIRSNEKAYLVAPPHVMFKILPEGSRGEGGQFIQWVDHHDGQMARNVLAGFLTMGRDSRGTMGFGSRLTDMFVSSLNGIAKGIAGDMKKQVVTDLCHLNIDMTGRQIPSVVCRDLEQVDLENMVTLLAKMSGTLITPDDDIESMLRKMLKLPPQEKSLTRKAKMAAGVGTQAAAANVADQTAHTPGTGNATGTTGVVDDGTSAADAVEPDQ